MVKDSFLRLKILILSIYSNSIGITEFSIIFQTVFQSWKNGPSRMSSKNASSSSIFLEDPARVEVLEGWDRSTIPSRESVVRVGVGASIVKTTPTSKETARSIAVGSWLSSVDFSFFFLSVLVARVFLFCRREGFNFAISFVEDSVSTIIQQTSG